MVYGHGAWGLSPSQYIQEALSNYKSYIQENLYINVISTELVPHRLSVRARHVAWATAWACFILSVLYGDVQMDDWAKQSRYIRSSSMSSSHMVLPRQEHLEVALYVMPYLSLHPNFRLWIEPVYPNVDSTQFPVCDWSEFYSHNEEHILLNLPEAIEKVVNPWIIIKSEHEGAQQTNRLHTGFLSLYALVLLTTKMSQ